MFEGNDKKKKKKSFSQICDHEQLRWGISAQVVGGFLYMQKWLLVATAGIIMRCVHVGKNVSLCSPSHRRLKLQAVLFLFSLKTDNTAKEWYYAL